MSPDLKFHHIGIATKNFQKAIQTYKSLGYSVVSESMEVPTQNVRVCFLEKQGHPLLELIEPSGDSSPIHNLLKKNGSGPYHLCYTTSDINETIKNLKILRFLIFSNPVESNAFNNNLIIFAYKDDIGFIEIVESPLYSNEGF